MVEEKPTGNREVPEQEPLRTGGTGGNHVYVGQVANMVVGDHNEGTQNYRSTGLSASDLAQLMQVLNQILAKTNVANTGEREVRNAARDIIESYEKNEELPKEGRSWLEAARDRVPSADHLFSLINNAIDILSKLLPPGTGA